MDWVSYGVIGAVIVVAICVAVLIWKKKITLGSIEIGWPPKITLVANAPKAGDLPSGDKDEISAKNKGKIGNVTIEGAAPSTTVTADGGTIGDVNVKRKM